MNQSWTAELNQPTLTYAHTPFSVVAASGGGGGLLHHRFPRACSLLGLPPGFPRGQKCARVGVKAPQECSHRQKQKCACWKGDFGKGSRVENPTNVPHRNTS